MAVMLMSRKEQRACGGGERNVHDRQMKDEREMRVMTGKYSSLCVSTIDSHIKTRKTDSHSKQTRIHLMRRVSQSNGFPVFLISLVSFPCCHVRELEVTKLTKKLKKHLRWRSHRLYKKVES